MTKTEFKKYLTRVEGMANDIIKSTDDFDNVTRIVLEESYQEYDYIVQLAKNIILICKNLTTEDDCITIASQISILSSIYASGDYCDEEDDTESLFYKLFKLASAMQEDTGCDAWNNSLSSSNCCSCETCDYKDICPVVDEDPDDED